MYNKLIYNAEEKLIDIIDKINLEKGIKEIDVYVAYTNIFSLSKIIEVLKKTQHEIIINIYYSDLSTSYKDSDNLIIQKGFLEYVNYIIIDIFNSYYQLYELVKENIQFIKFKIFELSFPKYLYKNIQEFFMVKYMI